MRALPMGMPDFLHASDLKPPINGMSERFVTALCDGELLVVPQVARKQLRWTAHLDLNRLPTAVRLWWAYVASHVSVDCYRPVAAAGRRAGSTRS
jgi:hypothetical protein